MKKKQKILAADFETTVYPNQIRTDVWASACVELYTEDVKIFHSIEETMDYYLSLNTNLIVYYHNLKFDGAFWLNYLLSSGWKMAFNQIDDLACGWFDKKWDMPSHSFIYSISDRGQWYSIVIRHNKTFIEIRDSLKLLPFKLETIGESFGTKHKKLSMEYEGFRFPGCRITEENQEYIANDVLVLKEALEFMFDNGHNKLTIGSCCLDEYKKGMPNYSEYFPEVYKIPFDLDKTGATTLGDYIKKSYRGGWCYNVPNKSRKIMRNGVTIDVNSLYPSMMHSSSGNRYPIGEGVYKSADRITIEELDKLWENGQYYFIRFRTRFYIKENMLPFIQIKNNPLYRATLNLTTSDVYNKETGEYCQFYSDYQGLHPAVVEMTQTCVDFKLFREHYKLDDFEFLDCVIFDTAIGLFDEYLDYWKDIKYKATGAMRTLAKLFMNNLYGKFATNDNSSFKVSYLKDNGALGFYSVEMHDKKPGYIPVGSAITSYARNFTIRAAQANYYGPNSRGFIYADTDSLHCDISADELRGITIDPVKFSCWKLESEWDEAIFVRQKTYIEHIVLKDGKHPKKGAFYDIKCAGLPDKCKTYFNQSLTKTIPAKEDITDEDEMYFFYDENGEPIYRTLKDFDLGLTIPGKLMPKQIPGGVLLVNTWYEMRG